MCVTLQNATCRCVEVGVVQFLCMHLVVVSEREISDVVLCEFCITMTKSGVGPNCCVSSLQVQVKRVTHGLAVFAWGML